MAVTINGTNGIVFNDGTTQSTAITSTTVLNATAGAAVGAVGTYAFMVDVNLAANATRTPGTTLAGTGLRYGGAALAGGNYAGSSTATPAVAGTWRLMGFSAGPVDGGCGPVGDGRLSLWLRIS